jgi:hypothetical protein
MGATELTIAVSNGQITKKVVQVSRRRTGIYIAGFTKRFGGAHTTYHNDGSFFFRADRIPGPEMPMVKRAPLADIVNMEQICFMSLPLLQAEFNRLPALTSRHKGRIVILDYKEVGERIALSTWVAAAAKVSERRTPPDYRRLHSDILNDGHPSIIVDVYAA